jgi:hypothetical protein
MYQVTVYKQLEGRWHYARLSADDSGRYLTETGRVGALPTHVESLPLPEALSIEDSLHKAAQGWLAQGYGIPHRSEWQVLSLHFSMKSWQGFTSGAPWFEDWKLWYNEPMNEILETRAHAAKENDMPGQVGDYLVLHKYVLEGEYAAHAIQQLFGAAPVVFPFKIYLGEREKYPEIQYSPYVPEELTDILRGLESAVSTMTDISQEIVLQKVTSAVLPIQRIEYRPRVAAEQARVLRQDLRDQWGFECGIWEPIGPPAKQEVVYLGQFPTALEKRLRQLISAHTQVPIYRMDYDEGITLTTPEQALRLFPYEGVVFAADMSWIVYFSHHHTFTFGGQLLVAAVRDYFKDQPEQINRW